MCPGLETVTVMQEVEQQEPEADQAIQKARFVLRCYITRYVKMQKAAYSRFSAIGHVTYHGNWEVLCNIKKWYLAHKNVIKKFPGNFMDVILYNLLYTI